MKLQYFNFWRELNENVSLYPHQPSNVFGKILLQNLYDSLNESTRNRIASLNTLNNVRTVATLGLDRIFGSNNQAKISKHQKLILKVTDLMEQFKDRKTTELYFKLVMVLMKIYLKLENIVKTKFFLE